MKSQRTKQIGLRITKEQYEMIRASRIPYNEIFDKGVELHFHKGNKLLKQKLDTIDQIKKQKMRLLDEEVDLKAKQRTVELLETNITNLESKLYKIETEILENIHKMQVKTKARETKLKEVKKHQYNERVERAMNVVVSNAQNKACSLSDYIATHIDNIEQTCDGFEVSVEDVVTKIKDTHLSKQN